MPATLDASMELTILGSQPDDPDGRSGLIGVDDEADFVVVAIDHAGRILVVRPFELGKPNYVGESIRDAYAERGDAPAGGLRVAIQLHRPDPHNDLNLSRVGPAGQFVFILAMDHRGALLFAKPVRFDELEGLENRLLHAYRGVPEDGVDLSTHEGPLPRPRP
jgi:hypothetical protein